MKSNKNYRTNFQPDIIQDALKLNDSKLGVGDGDDPDSTTLSSALDVDRVMPPPNYILPFCSFGPMIPNSSLPMISIPSPPFN